jgi:predicted ATPase
LPEEDARRNLRVEISKLRRWLEPYLVFTHQEAMLNPEAPIWVDVDELEKRSASLQSLDATDKLDQLVAASALYRGDFLSGFLARAAPLFEEWLLVERERLRQAALRLLEQLIEASIQQQDWPTGLAAVRKALAIDNWRETSHFQLITLLALSGDRSAALAQFEITRRTLVQELGIEPGAEIVGLVQRIRSGEFSPASPPTIISPSASPRPEHNLPAPTTSFVGRQAELQQLQELLNDPGCRLLVLTGPGGIGKTRLALELCWKFAVAPATIFKDGITLIPLETVSDAQLVATSIAETLKVPISGAQDPLHQLAQYLSNKQMLLMLDNFEQLVECADQLVQILHTAPGIKLLVTSRSQLHLYEEWVFPVDGLPYPEPENLPGWQEASAVQLFQQRARKVNLRFSLQANQSGVIRLCRLLEGHPLGIELAAAWVNMLPIENIIQQIEDNLSLTEGQIRNLPARQRSLQAVFQYSWDLLAPEEQHALAKLTVFQGEFSVQAAQAVLQTRPRLLASLTGKSLLRFSPHGRYEMHSLLHSFAEDRLAQGEKELLQTVHSRYYANFLSQRGRDFASPHEAQAIDEIATEISNLRAGWRWAIDHIPSAPASPSPEQIDLIAQYISPLSTFYFRKSWFREAEQVFAQALEKIETTGFEGMPLDGKAPLALGLVSLAQARHCRALGKNTLAQERITKAIQLLAQYGEGAELADAWHIHGQIEQQTGALANAEQAYQNSLRIYRALEQPTGVASNLISLGVLAKNRGDLNGASMLYQECLGIFEQRGDPRGVWTCLINLGNIANVKQDFQEAKRLYDQAFERVQHSTDRSRQALTLLNLGSVAREVGESQQALQYYQDSLRISQEIGEARIQVASLDGLGKTHLALGELTPAQDYLLSALQSAVQANLLPQALDSLASYAHLLNQRRQPQQAASILTYVIAQPACPDYVRQSAQREFESIQAQAPEHNASQATQQWQGLSLPAVVGALQEQADRKQRE